MSLIVCGAITSIYYVQIPSVSFQNNFKPRKIEITSYSRLDEEIRSQLFDFISSIYQKKTTPDLPELVENIQKEWGFESVHALHTPLDTLWLKVKNRTPIATISFQNNLYPITKTAQIYRGAKETLEHLVSIKGVLNKTKKVWQKNHALNISAEETKLLRETLSLFEQLQKYRLQVVSITHQKHRGYHVRTHNDLEITFGYAPFEKNFEKLMHIQETKKDQWSLIQKIELDFRDKVFIAYKS